MFGKIILCGPSNMRFYFNGDFSDSQNSNSNNESYIYRYIYISH